MTDSFTCGGIFDLASKEARVKELETLMEQPRFWDNNENAQKVIAECNQLKTWTAPFLQLQKRFSDVRELLPEAVSTGEEDLLEDLQQELLLIDKELEALEVRKMLSGELDDKNCYLSINSGAGGTEACDWALMLSRMYQRWAASRGWNVEMIDAVEGDVAGIKSVTFKFSGEYAYGYAKSEKGVHRLVRISPFDSNAKRHTSFASVDVTPEIGDDISYRCEAGRDPNRHLPLFWSRRPACQQDRFCG